MEKSMSEDVERGQGINRSLVFTTACGFALYWACFFTMLMRNSFMDGGIEILWYHFFLRIIFLAGSVVMYVIMALATNFLSTQKGVRLQRIGVFVFPLVAATGSLAAHSLGTALPFAFDCVAWALAGLGLACLFMPWVELLGSYERGAGFLGLVASIMLGACAYLVMNMLPFPFNIALLCVSPIASLAIAVMLERSNEVVPAPFVPREDSRKNARIAPAFKVMTIAYGVVLGLGIGLTTLIRGDAALYTGIACAMALGAVASVACLHQAAQRIQYNGAFQILFPVLIIALIPMSFLQGLPATLCNLLVLACYALFETIGIYLALFLAERYHASRLCLVSIMQACLLSGLLVGHLIGLVATSSGAMDYPMLSVAALALVVVLALMVTFFGIAPIDTGKATSTVAGNDGDDSEAPHGHWKAACQGVARENGLSARETEVFMLLAKGRGIEHIQGKLCISGHTVKSHVYNIYRKMEINSREELLDVVENARKGRDDASSPTHS